MSLADSTLWWLAAGVLVAAELLTGTFFLLMLALGASAGALAAHAGLGPNSQFVGAAILGGGAVAAWQWRRSRRPPAKPASADPAVNLDVGGRVHVSHWHGDGTARVNYRGAAWDVRFVGSGEPAAGDHVIRAVDGNQLLLERSPG